MATWQGGVALPAAAAVVRIGVKVCSVVHSGNRLRVIRTHQLQRLTHVAPVHKHLHHLATP